MNLGTYAYLQTRGIKCIDNKLYTVKKKKKEKISWIGTENFVYKQDSTDFQGINNSCILPYSGHFRKSIILYFLYSQ